MDPDLRRHIIALLELGIRYSEDRGLTEGRMTELAQDQNLSHDKMREAIKHLGEIGALNLILEDPERPYGISQAFVTDVGKMYCHQLVAESRQNHKRTNRKIFIIHGRDEENKNILKEMLTQWNFKPLVMAELPSMNLTLIEKLVRYVKDVEFAFVLMTPDDIGSNVKDFVDFLKDYSDEIVEGLQQTTNRIGGEGGDLDRAIHSLVRNSVIGLERKMKRRVRQNVLFEYGLCVGKLGRENVCPILKGEVEIPTDILGAVYIPFKDKISECKDKIRQELDATGYEIPEEQ